MRFFKIMQSQRINSGSHFLRQESALLEATKNNTINRRKPSVGTQTENFTNFGKEELLGNFCSMSIDEMKNNYVSTLGFLNCCHEFINDIFGDSTFGHSKLEKMIGFRVPEVPNYFHVLEMFLDKSGNQISDPNWSKIEHLKEGRRTIDINDVRHTAKDVDEEQIIFDLQQFHPKNIGDGPSSIASPRGAIRNTGVENFTNQPMFRDCEIIRVENDIIKSIAPKKRPSTASPSRLVKSEKDILKRPSRHELKALSAFEEILNTCNEFKRKSKEHLFKNHEALDEYSDNFNGAECNNHLEKYDPGDQNNERKEQQMLMDDVDFQTDPAKNVPQNFNLIDYALKNLNDSEYEWDSPPLSPKIRVSRNTSGNVSMIPSRGGLMVIDDDLSDASFKVSVTKKKSWTVLNTTCKSQSPQKVNEMFEKISRENLRSPGMAGSSCELSDGETFIKFIDNGDLSDDYEQEYCNRGMLKNCARTIEDDDIDVKVESSTDSIILTDEEFERKNRNGCVLWSQENPSVKKEQRSKKSRNTKSDGFVQKIAYKPMVQSHPLKLTEKDRSLADQRVLEKIGLFTEKGDFRPGVVSILEEKKRMSFTKKSAKNFQFRTERKFDINLLPATNKINPIEKEFCRGSRTGRNSINGRTCSNTSLHSSAVTFSSSTVSDSDLLNMEPQTVIKKF